MRKLSGLVMLLLLIASFASATTAAAQDPSCGNIMPSRHSFGVVDDEGIQGGGPSSDTATLRFRFTQDEIDAARCAGTALVVDFAFTNYEFREGETEVAFNDHGLGSYQYVVTDDPENPIMRAAGIDPWSLVANKTYTVQVTFRMFYAVGPNTGIPHTLTAEMAPGEFFAESYLGECSDLLLDEAEVAGSTYCFARYDEQAVELGVHTFTGY